MLAVLLSALPDAGAVDTTDFDQIDAQVAAEAARVSQEQRAAIRERDRLLAQMQAKRTYFKIVTPEIRPMQVESLSRAYVEACLGLHAPPRRCPGSSAFFVEWLLVHEAEAFEVILRWTRTHGAKNSVPEAAVPRVVSVEQAIDLADASPVDTEWLLAASRDQRLLSAEQRRLLFERLLQFDRKAPGSLVYALGSLDHEGTCRYLEANVPKAKRQRLPINCAE